MRSGARWGRGSRFPEGRGRRALVARRVMQGDGGARRFRGIMQEGAEGRRFRRVAAVPVCPPFRDRSRGSREAGVAPPVAGGCCEAGLHRCGWRGAAVPAGLCKRAQRGGGPAGLCKRAQGTAARRVTAMSVCPPFRDRSRGGREAGAAPPVAGGCCEAGLRRCGWRGAVARRVMRGDGGARRFRGIMQEGAGDGGPAGGCRAGLPAIS